MLRGLQTQWHLSSLFALSIAMPLTAASEFLSFDPLRGYADAGIAVSDASTSGLEAGSGKLRYGEGGNEISVDPKLSEARLIGAVGLGRAWRLSLDIKYDDAQRHLLDISEAFVSYRGPPHASGIRWRIKAGTFLPPFSLENRAIGWTSPYSLSSSALNAWVGEELRINGAEVRMLVDRGGWQYSLSAASYFANDAAGTSLAFRGFALHERELGLFDRMRLPRFQVGLIDPRGPFRAQARFFEPLHEIDHRPGFYAGLTVSTPRERRFEAYYYNNNADPAAFNQSAGQYAWRTRFWVAGFETPLPWSLRFISQAMLGDTAMGLRANNLQPRGMQMDYFSGYGLVSRVFTHFQAGARAEYFEIRDKDAMRFIYDNAESGYGLTFTAMRALTLHSKVYLETQYTEHERPVRVFAGLPRREGEWLLRLNLRWYL